MFAEHIKRAAKMAMRSEKSVIYDTYINPRYNASSLSDLFRWIHECDLQIYSTWPPVSAFQLLDSTWEEPVRFESNNLNSLLFISEMGLMSVRDNDIKRVTKFAELLKKYENTFRLISNDINDVDSVIDINELKNSKNEAEILFSNIDEINTLLSDNYFRPISTFISEYISIITFLENGNYSLEQLKKEIENTEYLFKGVQGNPQTYIVATHPLY